MDTMFRSVNKLKVQELRDLCKRNDLDSSGTKPILVQRLKDYMAKTHTGTGINDSSYCFSTDTSMEKYENNSTLNDETANKQDDTNTNNENNEDSSSFVDEPQYIYSDQEETDYEEEMLPEDYEKVSSDNEEVDDNEKNESNISSHLMDDKVNKETESTIQSVSFASTASSASDLAANKKLSKSKKTKKELIIAPPSNEIEVEALEHLSLDGFVIGYLPYDIIVIDNSDLHFVITDPNCLQGCNLTKNDLSHFWCSATTNLGIKPGCKVYFECKYIRNLEVDLPVYEIPDHALRIGFTTKEVSHLGDSPQSIGIESSGKFYQNSKVISTSSTRFGINDVIGVFLDTTCDPAIFTFSKNGTIVGDIGGKLPLSAGTLSQVPGSTEDLLKVLPNTLYPCIFFKNVEFAVNFKVNTAIQEKNDFMPLDSPGIKNFTVANNLPIGLDQCEVIMMSGIVGSGKTTWVSDFLKSKPAKQYTIIGRTGLYERWRVIGQARKVRLSESIASNVLAKLTSLAIKRPCCCILDQSNCHSSSRKKRMEQFNKYPSRKAMIIIPHLAEYQSRISKAEQDRKSFSSDERSIHESDILRYKNTYTLPSLKEGFTELIYVGSSAMEAKCILNDYRYDADKAKELNKHKTQRKILLDRVRHLSTALRKATERPPEKSERSGSSSKKSPAHSPAVSAYSSRTYRRSHSPPHEYNIRNGAQRTQYQYNSRGDITLPRRNEESRKRSAPTTRDLPPPPLPPTALPHYRETNNRNYMNVSPSRDSYRSSTVVRTTYSSNQRDPPPVYPSESYDVDRSRSQRINSMEQTMGHGYRTNPVDYDSRSPMPPRDINRSTANESFGRDRVDRYRPPVENSTRTRVDNTRNTNVFRSRNTVASSGLPSASHQSSNWNSSHYNFPMDTRQQSTHQNTRQWESSRPQQPTKLRGDYGGFSEKSPLRAPRDTGRTSNYRGRYA